MHAETDVESLQTRLSTLTEKQTLAKGIKDVQNISIFRADFRPLKRIVLPNISKVKPEDPILLPISQSKSTLRWNLTTLIG